MATGGIPVAGAGAGQVGGGQAAGELRRGAIGFGGVLFQSITFMAPAIATAFSIPIGMEFAGGATPLAGVFALFAPPVLGGAVAPVGEHLPSARSLCYYVRHPPP